MCAPCLGGVGERLGDHLFSVARVDQDPIRERVDGVAVTPVQGTQGICFASRYAVQQLSVRHLGRVVEHDALKTAEPTLR